MFASLRRLPLACLNYTNLHTFGVALSISIVMHGITLGTTIGEPPKNKRVRDRGLEVILVNAHSKNAPRKEETQALAQVNLDGGGNTDKNRRVASPLPPTVNKPGDQTLDLRRRIESLEREQRQLLSAKRSKDSILQNTEQIQSENPSPSPGFDPHEAYREMKRLEGEIAKDTEAYNKRPRKAWSTTRTLEYQFAQYIHDWAQKVERWGTLNYPEAARGKIYGSLILTVIIDRNGQVVEITVDKPSPHPILNEAARRIVMTAAPYAPFPPNVSQYDQLVITRTWSFTQGNRIESR
ncbi:MAG: TonB family protein [Betaproteobacteria bacterium]|nr:TonB family protein [Betaproteobacteria bacterium]